MDDKAVSQHVQDCFVLLAITDEKFLATSRHCVKSSYFGSTVTESLINICYSFYDQFQKPPGDHLHDELTRFLSDKDDDTTELYIAYLQKIQQLNVPNQEYIMSRMNAFIKAREFSEAAIQFTKLAQEGKFDEGEQLMMAALKQGVALDDPGLVYFDNEIPTYIGVEAGRELIGLGIPAFGELVKLKRRQLVCILGGGKGKKSWFCLHLGAIGLHEGLNVLYVTHEMHAEEVEMRYDMMFSGLVSRAAYSRVSFVDRDDTGRITAATTEHVGTVEDIAAVQSGRRAIQRFGGKLVIKKYPMGLCTVGEFERYLDYLEVFMEFIPDIVINDYPDIMELPGSPAEIERNKINICYKHMKRIVDQRNILMLVPSQTNREALEKPYLGKKDFAEDIRKLANCDLIIGLAQSKELVRANCQRVSIIGGRSDEDGFNCLISQNIRIGAVVVDSWFERDDEDNDEDINESQNQNNQS